MISPFFFPVTAATFNFVSPILPFFLLVTLLITLFITQAGVIFGAITVFGFLSWYFTPPENWLRREQVLQALEASN